MNPAELEEALFEQLRPRSTGGPNALPYLFVGSGLSLRYLGLPTWDKLLETFAEECGLNYYELLSRLNGDRPGVASEIAQKFHPVWFNASKYESQRDEFSGIESRELPLKIAVAAHLAQNSTLSSGVPGADVEALAAEIEAARACVVDGVITTNYDTLVSGIFQDFSTFIGQDDLILSDAQFVSEVYQIHGSVKDPASLVLTTADYEKIDRQSAYLVAKLLTIFVEHPVVFIGYSITDAYVQKILRQVAEAVTPGRLAELAERLVFIEWNRDLQSGPLVLRRDIALQGGGSLTVTQVETHSFLPLFRALGRLERPFPRQLLRQLSSKVYELFSDPSVTKVPVSVVPIDSPNAEGLSVVFGVGEFAGNVEHELSLVGLQAVPREHLARDILGTSRSQYSDDLWIMTGLPSMKQQWSNAYLPVYKYLNGAGRVSDSGIDVTGLPPEIEKIIAHTAAMSVARDSRRRFVRDGHDGRSPREIFELDLPEYFMLQCLALLDVTDADEVDALRDVLREYLETADEQGKRLDTYFWQALCHYDKIAFEPASGSGAGSE